MVRLKQLYSIFGDTIIMKKINYSIFKSLKQRKKKYFLKRRIRISIV